MEDDNNLLLIAVFTTLTIILWVFFELIQTTKTSTVAQPLQQVVLPLSSKIDTTVIDQLETKKTFD